MTTPNEPKQVGAPSPEPHGESEEEFFGPAEQEPVAHGMSEEEFFGKPPPPPPPTFLERAGSTIAGAFQPSPGILAQRAAMRKGAGQAARYVIGSSIEGTEEAIAQVGRDWKGLRSGPAGRLSPMAELNMRLLKLGFDAVQVPAMPVLSPVGRAAGDVVHHVADRYTPYGTSEPTPAEARLIQAGMTPQQARNTRLGIGDPYSAINVIVDDIAGNISNVAMAGVGGFEHALPTRTVAARTLHEHGLPVQDTAEAANAVIEAAKPGAGSPAAGAAEAALVKGPKIKPMPLGLQTEGKVDLKIHPDGKTSAAGGPPLDTIYMAKDRATALKSYLDAKPDRTVDLQGNYAIVREADGTPVQDAQMAFGRRTAIGRVPVQLDKGKATFHDPVASIVKPPKPPDDGIPQVELPELAQRAKKRGGDKDVIFAIMLAEHEGKIDKATARRQIWESIPGMKKAPPETPLETEVPVKATEEAPKAKDATPPVAPPVAEAKPAEPVPAGDPIARAAAEGEAHADELKLTKKEMVELVGEKGAPAGFKLKQYAGLLAKKNPELIQGMRAAGEKAAKGQATLKAAHEAGKAQIEAQMKAMKEAYPKEKKEGESYDDFVERKNAELAAELDKKFVESGQLMTEEQTKAAARDIDALEKKPVSSTAAWIAEAERKIKENDARLGRVKPSKYSSLEQALKDQPTAPQTLEGAFLRAESAKNPTIVYKGTDLKRMLAEGKVTPEAAHIELVEALGYDVPREPPPPSIPQAAAALSDAQSKLVEMEAKGLPTDPRDPYYNPTPFTEAEVSAMAKDKGVDAAAIRAMEKEILADKAKAKSELQQLLLDTKKNTLAEEGKPKVKQFWNYHEETTKNLDVAAQAARAEARALFTEILDGTTVNPDAYLDDFLTMLKNPPFDEQGGLGTPKRIVPKAYMDANTRRGARKARLTVEQNMEVDWAEEQIRAMEAAGQGPVSLAHLDDIATDARMLGYSFDKLTPSWKSPTLVEHVMNTVRPLLDTLQQQTEHLENEQFGEWNETEHTEAYVRLRAIRDAISKSPPERYEFLRELLQEHIPEHYDLIDEMFPDQGEHARPMFPGRGSAGIREAIDHFELAEQALRPSWAIRRHYDKLYKDLSGWFALPGMQFTTHQFLDKAIQLLPEGYLKTYYKFLRKTIDNFQIEIHDSLTDDKGHPAPNRVGEFTWVIGAEPTSGLGKINLKAEPSWMGVKGLTHELTHGVTARFIQDNPDHPLTRQLRDLYAQLRRSLSESRKTTGQDTLYFYGTAKSMEHGIHEMLAEAFSHEPFMNWIGKIEDYSTSAAAFIKNLVKKVQSTIFKVVHTALGLPQDSGRLLQEIMDVGVKIMKKEASIRKEGPEEWLDYGMRRADMAQRVQRTLKPGERQMTLEATARGKAQRVPPKRSGLRDNAFATAWDHFMRAIAPESRPTFSRSNKKPATVGGAFIANRIAQFLHATGRWEAKSQERMHGWQKNHLDVREFIRDFEQGKIGPGHKYEAIAKEYKNWAFNIWAQDFMNGINYAPRDNYLPHLFKNADDVQAYFYQKYKKKWGDPYFMKDRVFSLYEEAIRARFEPRFTNPEEMMLSRQMASDLAKMQVDMLEDLRRNGLAIDKPRKQPDGWEAWRAPNGQSYWVHPDVMQIMKNRFTSASLWKDASPIGLSYRGWMHIKNTLVPLRLNWPAFHAIHILTIDMAHNMMMGAKMMLGGNIKQGLPVLLRSLSDPVSTNPWYGARLIRLMKGLPVKGGPTSAEAQALQYIGDSSFNPFLSDLHKTNAGARFMKALREQKYAVATLRLIPSILELPVKPLFEWWIPQLKTAAFVRQAALALDLDKSLAGDEARRKVALRRIANSIDNRYGEMSYDTLFWNRTLKNVMVASTLSMGWNLGFLREYGGAIPEIFRERDIVGGKKVSRLASGNYDKALFTGIYSIGALTMGALMHYFLSGQRPGEKDGEEGNLGDFLYDCVYPTTGFNEDGSPQRITTMHFTREFASIIMHSRNEGLASGLEDTIINKGAGVLGPISDFFTGTDKFGKQISNPNSDAFKQLVQRLEFTLGEFEPITMQAILDPKKAERPYWQPALGFATAPRYAEETPAEGHIRIAYQNFVKAQKEPFDRVMEGQDHDRLRQMYKAKDPDFFEQFNEVANNYQLDGRGRQRLLKSLEDTKSPYFHMFQKVGTTSWGEQKHLLGYMSTEEKKQYLPFVESKHRYEVMKQIQDEEAGVQ